MGNKRKNKRVRCGVPVEAKVGGPFAYTKTVDISQKGLGVVSRNDIPISKEIAIEIDFQENTDPIFAIGEVKWINPISGSGNYRIGVFFKDILRGSRASLNEYLRSCEVKHEPANAGDRRSADV